VLASCRGWTHVQGARNESNRSDAHGGTTTNQLAMSTGLRHVQADRPHNDIVRMLATHPRAAPFYEQLDALVHGRVVKAGRGFLGGLAVRIQGFARVPRYPPRC